MLSIYHLISFFLLTPFLAFSAEIKWDSLEENAATFLDLQEVEIRGFYYISLEGQAFLAKQPNLKSCCIGSKKLIQEQIALSKPLINNTSGAITVKGKLRINSKHGHAYEEPYLYFLEEPEIVNKQSHSIWRGLIIFSILTVFFAYLYYFDK